MSLLAAPDAAATLYASPPAFNDSDVDRFIVYLHGVTVVFDGFKALDIPRFGLFHNELRVIIGPNGAGKTTLCDVISGKTRSTTGRVFFNRHEITREAEVDIASAGVGRKFQTPTVFDSLTVYENMELALPGHRGVLANLWARTSRFDHSKIEQVLERVHLIDDRNRQAKYLSHGQRQWLEISMLIVAEPKLLLVDEPAAGLTDHETELTAQLLLELSGSHSIIVIEHDMEFVRKLNSTVTVLNEGRLLAEGWIEEVQADPAVIEAYLGR